MWHDFRLAVECVGWLVLLAVGVGAPLAWVGMVAGWWSTPGRR